MKSIIALLLTGICVLSCAAQPFQWVSTLGDAGVDRTVDIATDPAGHVYIAGTFTGLLDLDPGPAVLADSTNGSTDFFIQKLTPTGDLVYGYAFGGVAQEMATGITADATGNAYITGYIQSVMDMDPGPGSFLVGSAGILDIFVLKLDPTGDLLWASTIGGATLENGRAIALDAASNIHIAGYFTGTVDFDPGPGADFRSSAGGNDIFVLKLGSDGSHLWTATMGGPGMDIAEAIAVDDLGNVLTTGTFADSADLDPGADIDMLTSTGGLDIFVSKLDVNGAFVWAKGFGGLSGEDAGRSIAVNSAGEVHVAGHFANIVDFDPDGGVDQLTSAGGVDAFINVFDANGAHLWAARIGSSSEDRGFKLVTDATDHLFLTGLFSNSADLDPGPGTAPSSSLGGTDAFILRLEPTGALLSALTLGGTGDDRANAFALLPDGSFVVGGSFVDTVDFDPGIGDLLRPSAGSEDAFVLKLGDFTTSTTEQGTTPLLPYPNPATDHLNVQRAPGAAPAPYAIHDALGRTLLHGTLTTPNSTLDIRALPAGTYLLRTDEGPRQVLRFVKW
ncbi:MAG TPA: T9SS type A sorting domain-containing protein [Flavobacteriales bacterium]|nr:T9SS type A sorting domain-containing protein [Flavobacteriales bacterium]